MLAAACAVLSGGKVDNEIVQVTRVFHTGADPMRGIKMRFLTSSVSKSRHSQPTKPSTSSGSKRLARSEIDLLRQEKKSISDYALKEFAGRMRAKKVATSN